MSSIIFSDFVTKRSRMCQRQPPNTHCCNLIGMGIFFHSDLSCVHPDIMQVFQVVLAPAHTEHVQKATLPSCFLTLIFGCLLGKTIRNPFPLKPSCDPLHCKILVYNNVPAPPGHVQPETHHLFVQPDQSPWLSRLKTIDPAVLHTRTNHAKEREFLSCNQQKAPVTASQPYGRQFYWRGGINTFDFSGEGKNWWRSCGKGLVEPLTFNTLNTFAHFFCGHQNENQELQIKTRKVPHPWQQKINNSIPSMHKMMRIENIMETHLRSCSR